MRSLRLALPLLGAAALSACAAADHRSYVGDVAPADALVLAGGVGDFVALQVRTPFSTIALDPVPSGQIGNPVTPAIASALNDRGFGVAANRSVAAGAHSLTYEVTPFDEGGLIRMTLDDDTKGARYFARSGGQLRAGGPLTVIATGGAQ